MKEHFVELPEWEFEVEEVSAGFYEVTGRDKVGHQVAAEGIDPTALLEQCRKYALHIAHQLSSQKKS